MIHEKSMILGIVMMTIVNRYIDMTISVIIKIITTVTVTTGQV